MLEAIEVSEKDLQRLYQHADACLPLEAVALLFGRVNDNSASVTRVELVENTLKSRTSFAVDPMKQYQLLMEADENDEELICIFHSHPSDAKPSESDRENMKLNPVVWLIASRKTGSWKSRAFIFVDNKIKEMRVETD